MSQNKEIDIRRYIAPFITGTNSDALVAALADEAQKQENLSVAVTDQLTISTASGAYLDKRLSEKGITRPPELGMSDLAFRRLGIKITAQKQITEVIQSVLEIFYGPAAVRAYTITTAFGPYNLEDGDDLIFSLEDGITRTVVFYSSDFASIAAATASEVADVITRYINSLNLNGYADVDYDLVNKKEYVRMFGGAKGPYSTITILGGKAQTQLQFPQIRPTSVALPDTAWQVTRPSGSVLRFRWSGNSKPALESVKPGDKVMMYGAMWEQNGFSGTYDIVNVLPASSSPNLDAGYFEIVVEETGGLSAVQAGATPPPNAPPVYYSYTLIQATNFDVMFMLPKKSVPNNKTRYALAYEPGDYLKIYLPATTSIISRELPGGAYMHVGQSSLTFDVSAGNASPGFNAALGHEITEVLCVEDVGGSLQDTFFFIPYEYGYYGFWVDVDNTTITPPAAMLLIANQYSQIEIVSGSTASVVASAVQAVINATGYWSTTIATDTVTATDLTAGPRTPDANEGGTPFTITTLQQGQWVYNDLSSAEWNQKIIVISDYAFSFRQNGYDMTAIGGEATFSTPVRSAAINSVHREQFMTTVICSEPHLIQSYIDPFGTRVTDDTCSITVDIIDTDSQDPADQWPGPYATDAQDNYTLTTHYAFTREAISAGATLTSIQINGTLPNENGLFMLNLDQDNEEGPFRYIAVQPLNSPPSVPILSASQNGFLITVTTIGPHGLLVNSQVTISGTLTAMDGTYQVVSTPSPTIFVCQSGTPAILTSSQGYALSVVDGARSIVLLDPSNQYTKNHQAGSDITQLSSADAYTPSEDGLDFPMYTTGTAQGRIYAQEVIDAITALGIKMEIKIIYPSGIGLGNQGGSDSVFDPPTSEVVYIWGSDTFYESQT